MSDGGRERASLGVNVWRSSQKWSGQRSDVRSIAWLDRLLAMQYPHDFIVLWVVVCPERLAAAGCDRRLEVREICHRVNEKTVISLRGLDVVVARAPVLVGADVSMNSRQAAGLLIR